MLVTDRPFVVSTMGSATAQHYNVSFFACYRSSFCGVHNGFCNRTAWVLATAQEEVVWGLNNMDVPTAQHDDRGTYVEKAGAPKSEAMMATGSEVKARDMFPYPHGPLEEIYAANNAVVMKTMMDPAIRCATLDYNLTSSSLRSELGSAATHMTAQAAAMVYMLRAMCIVLQLFNRNYSCDLNVASKAAYTAEYKRRTPPSGKPDFKSLVADPSFRSSVLYLMVMACLNHLRSKHLLAGEQLSLKQAKVLQKAMRFGDAPPGSPSNPAVQEWLKCISICFYNAMHLLDPATFAACAAVAPNQQKLQQIMPP